jgi:hypothetical protein
MSWRWSLPTLALALVCPAVAWSAELPKDLDAVPRNAVGFVHLRAAALWNSEVNAEIRRCVRFAGGDAIGSFDEHFAPAPTTFDRMTLVFLTPQSLMKPFPEVDPEAVSALVILRTSKPFDREAVRKHLSEREKRAGKHSYYFKEDMWSGLTFLDDQTFVIGSEDALLRYLEMKATDDAKGPLAAGLAAAAGNAHITAGINPSALDKDLTAAIPPPLAPLTKARSIATTISFGKRLQVDCKADFANADELTAGEKAAQAGIDMARAALKQLVNETLAGLKKWGTDVPKSISERYAQGLLAVTGIGILSELDTLLAKAQFQRDGTQLRLPLDVEVSSNAQFTIPLVAVAALNTSPSVTFSSVGRAIGEEDPNETQLKKLREAFVKFRDEKGHYPTAAIHDGNGQPTLSWRVALLPYLDEEALYKEFRLDEPWDSLHNKRLLKKLPAVYKASLESWRQPAKWKTSLLVFTGPGTIFEGGKGIKKEEVDDETILLTLLPNSKAVYWTKPADVPVVLDKPLPRLASGFEVAPVYTIAAGGKVEKHEPPVDADSLKKRISRKIEKK